MFVLFAAQTSFATTAQKFSQGKVKNQPAVLGAKTYNVYYKESQEKKFTHAVRLPANFAEYTINSLKKGTNYIYTIVAVDAQGKEFWRSNTKVLPRSN